MTTTTTPRRRYRIYSCPGALSEPSDCYVSVLGFEHDDIEHGASCLLGPLHREDPS